MSKRIEVYADIRQKVYVDPVQVLENINIIDEGDWIVKKDGKYIQMTEQSAGQHSFDTDVKEVTKEIYDLWKGQQNLINYLKYVQT